MARKSLLILLLVTQLALGRIDRQHVVSKCNVVRTSLIDNETTPLQVGNGNFAFNADNTGMQSFLPFNTLSSWAWHNDPLPIDGYSLQYSLRKKQEIYYLNQDSEKIGDYHGVAMLTHGRNVSYDIPDPHLPQASQWLISNPNRINLGRIGLQYKDKFLTASQISESHQVLNLWTGVITPTFRVDGQLVKVMTQGDFESDSAVFDIQSDLLSSGDLTVGLDFPYPPIHSTTYKYEVFVGSYDFP